MYTIVLAIVARAGPQNDQWMSRRGSALRSLRRSTGRNAPRSAALTPGRGGWVGWSVRAESAREGTSPAVAIAAAPPTGIDCSVRRRRRASVRSVRFARANGLLLWGGPSAGRAPRADASYPGTTRPVSGG